MTSCLITKQKNLKQIIDLGIHPYADTFINKNQLNFSEPFFSLQCFLNPNLGLIQSGVKTNAKDRYNLYDYSYTSSNSLFSKNHWDNFCNVVIKNTELKNKSYVLEIGSNDGYLLNRFKKNKMKVVGVDASIKMTGIANKKNITSLNMIFDKNSSKLLLKKFGKFDLIIANNVFNHSNDPLGFITSVKKLLKKDGTFVFEVPYWYSSMKTMKFDQIYHEHVTYFTVKFIKNLCKITDLNVFDIQEVDYHGGSLRVFIKNYNIKTSHKVTSKINKMITKEEKFGLFKLSFYKVFMKRIEKNKLILLSKIIKIKQKGFSVVGVGAAAKGNTFLNFHNLNSSLIDFITDSSKHKINKYTPLSRIKILSDNALRKKNNCYILFLSWNIKTSLKTKLLKINKNLKFI